MKTIQPLTYEIRLFKQWIIWKINNYKDINYLKNAIEDYLYYSDNMENFPTKEIDGKKVCLHKPIEIVGNYLFINFKYWEQVNEHDNSIILENDSITQEINKTWDLVSDFPCWIEFNVDEDSKFLKIFWKLTLLANWNQQMKSKVEKIFRDIYKQEEQVWFTEPTYKIDFLFTKDEMKIIDKRVSSIIFNYEVPHTNIFKSLADEEETKKKTAKIKVEFSRFWNYNEEKELETFIKYLEKNSPVKTWKLISKTVKVRQNNKYYQWNLKDENDEFIVQAKELVLASEKDISYEDFKKISKEFFEN